MRAAPTSSTSDVMTDFGSGIYLTNNDDLGPDWDMQVDETGDIRSSFRINELKKDVAYASAVALTGEIGQRRTPAVLNRIRSRARDVFRDEERIDSITTIDAQFVDNGTVEIVAIVRANLEEIELVFEVPV